MGGQTACSQSPARIFSSSFISLRVVSGETFVGRTGDLGGDGGIRSVRLAGVGDEDRDTVAPAVGQQDVARVVVGDAHAFGRAVRGAGLVAESDVAGQSRTEPLFAPVGASSSALRSSASYSAGSSPPRSRRAKSSQTADGGAVLRRWFSVARCIVRSEAAMRNPPMPAPRRYSSTAAGLRRNRAAGRRRCCRSAKCCTGSGRRASPCLLRAAASRASGCTYCRRAVRDLRRTEPKGACVRVRHGRGRPGPREP